MIVLHPFEVVAPLVKRFVPQGHCANAVCFHERMLFAPRAMKIEFFLEEMVNRTIEIEWKAARLFDAATHVQIETPRTVREKLQL